MPEPKIRRNLPHINSRITHAEALFDDLAQARIGHPSLSKPCFHAEPCRAAAIHSSAARSSTDVRPPTPIFDKASSPPLASTVL